jgi:hypothetical protein
MIVALQETVLHVQLQHINKQCNMFSCWCFMVITWYPAVLLYPCTAGVAAPLKHTPPAAPALHIKVSTKVLVKKGVSNELCNSRPISHAPIVKHSQGSITMHVSCNILAAQVKRLPPS